MVYCYWSITSNPVGPFGMRLSAIMADIQRLFGTVKVGFQPSPKRPRLTYPRFLLLCALLTLCSPVSCQSAESAITSKQLLTMYSMTCMELERKVSKSYLARGCLPLENESWPQHTIRWYRCPIRNLYGWGFVNSPSLTVPKYCSTAVGSCMFNGLVIEVFYIRSRYGDEICVGDDK